MDRFEERRVNVGTCTSVEGCWYVRETGVAVNITCLARRWPPDTDAWDGHEGCTENCIIYKRAKDGKKRSKGQMTHIKVSPRRSAD